MPANPLATNNINTDEYRKLAFLYEERNYFCRTYCDSWVFQLLFALVTAGYIICLARQYQDAAVRPAFVIVSIILSTLPFGRSVMVIIDRSNPWYCFVSGTTFYCCIYVLGLATDLTSTNALVSMTLIYRLATDKSFFDNFAILLVHFSALRDYSVRPRLFLAAAFVFGAILSHQLRKKLHAVWDAACFLLIYQHAYSMELATSRKIIAGSGPDGIMASLKSEVPTVKSINEIRSTDKDKDRPVLVEAVKCGLIPDPNEVSRLLNAANSKMRIGLRRYPLAVIAFKPIVFSDHDCMLQTIRQYELFAIIDQLAKEKDVHCVRRIGGAWIGCVGFTSSLGTGSNDCHRAILLAISVFAFARKRNIAVSCAIGYGTVTGGYIGSCNFDMFGEEIRWVLNHIEMRRSEIMVSEVVHFMVAKMRENDNSSQLFKLEVSVVPSLTSSDSEKVFVVVPAEHITKSADAQGLNCTLGVEPTLTDDSVPLCYEDRDQDTTECTPLISPRLLNSEMVMELLQCTFFELQFQRNNSLGLHSNSRTGSMERIVTDGGDLVDQWMRNRKQFSKQHYEVVSQLFTVVKRSVFSSRLEFFLLLGKTSLIQSWHFMFAAKWQERAAATAASANNSKSIRDSKHSQSFSVRVSESLNRSVPSHRVGIKQGSIDKRTIESSEDMVSSTRVAITDHNHMMADMYDTLKLSKEMGEAEAPLSRSFGLSLIDESATELYTTGNTDNFMIGKSTFPIAEEHKDDMAISVSDMDSELTRVPMTSGTNGMLFRGESAGSFMFEAPSLDSMEEVSSSSGKLSKSKAYSVDMSDCLSFDPPSHAASAVAGTLTPPTRRSTTEVGITAQPVIDELNESMLAVVDLENETSCVDVTSNVREDAAASETEDDDCYFVLADVAIDLAVSAKGERKTPAFGVEDEPDESLAQMQFTGASGSGDSRDVESGKGVRMTQHQSNARSSYSNNHGVSSSTFQQAVVPNTQVYYTRPRTNSDSMGESNRKKKAALRFKSMLTRLPVYSDLTREPKQHGKVPNYRIQNLFYGLPYIILGVTSYYSVGQLEFTAVSRNDLDQSEPAPMKPLGFAFGLGYLLYLLLPIIIVELHEVIYWKHLVLLGLQVFLMYYAVQFDLTNDLEGDHGHKDHFIQGEIVLGIFFVHCLHNNYLPFHLCLASNLIAVILIVGLLLGVRSTGRPFDSGPQLYFLFVALLHCVRWAMEFAHVSYYALLLEVLPRMIERYEAAKQANKSLISGQNNYVPLSLTNSLYSPRRLSSASVIAIHVKAVELVPDFLEEQATLQFLSSLYRVIDESINEAGMLKVACFSGVFICVSSQDPCMCSIENLRKPVNYATRAIVLMNTVQRRVDAHFNNDKVKISLGIGINHGPVVLGLLGSSQLYFDVCGATRDLAVLMAAGPANGNGFFASDLYSRLVLRDNHGGLANQVSSNGYSPRSVQVLFENTVHNWLRLDGSFNGIELIDFDYICELGKGGYGSVHLVQEKETGRRYAIKKVPIKYESSKMIRREFLILQQMQHFNVVNFMYCMVHSKSIYLVMAFVNGGNLQQIVKNYDDLDVDTFKFWFAELVSALEYVHSLGIIHRDVKPTNCMIGKCFRSPTVGVVGIIPDFFLLQTSAVT
jgi:hypothetical protein